ncbi:MAG TPA: hypothetical protein VN932_11715 [Rhizomicrobium sp.]|nr:hypothetical protein [Rhizomicrobium sp.]
MTIGDPVHQADEDNVSRNLRTTEARQGVATGRVVTVLAISLLLVVAIFAVMWLMR